MPENSEHKLQVGIGFKVEDTNGGITNLAEQAEKINNAMSNLTATMSKAEKGFKNVDKGVKELSKTYSKADTIVNKYKAGIIDSGEAMSQLRKEQSNLNQELKKVKEGSKEYDSLVAKLAKVKKEYDKLDKEETKAIENLIKKDEKAAKLAEKNAKESEKLAEEKYKIAAKNNKAETQSYDKEQQQRIKSAKNSAEVFKQFYKEQEQVARQELAKTTSAYKQAMTERKISSAQLGEMLRPVGTDFSSKVFNGIVRYSGARAILREFQNLSSAIVDINYNTINNQRLMGNFSKELRDSLNSSAAEIARNTGIMITDAQEIQGAWIRINEEYAKSPELLNEMADITAKFMNVGEVENAESAVKLLNSTLLQFKLNTGDVAANMEEVANKFAYMADVTAMGTADEYAEGIAKMGANIKNMNGDVDDAIVLLSIVGDKLAKNGTEAGNSLNTFTAYMQRTKTLDLFDKLAVQLGDANVKIREGEKGLKSYEDTLKAIASAYAQLREQGDKQGMNQIVEALGATRQRATAQALLDAISSTEENGKTALDNYYDMLSNATVEGSYLEKQNEALMTSFKNQYNSLSVTIQEAGMTIANAGVLDSLTLMMNGAESLVSVIKMIPQPVIQAATGFATLKIAMAGLEKMGKVTGYSKALAQQLQFGTKAQMENADATRRGADEFLHYQQNLFNTIPTMDRTAKSYQEQLGALTNYELAVKNNNLALASGEITIEQYTQKMGLAQKQYLKNVQATTSATRYTKEYTNANKISMNATRSSIALEKQKNVEQKKSLISLMSESGYKKKDMIIETARNAVKKISNALTAEGTANTIANTVATKAKAVADAIATGATTALGVAMHFLLSPLVLVTAAMTAFTWITGMASKGLEESKEKVDEYQNSIQEATSRLSELKEKQRQSGLSGTEEAELEYLQRKIKSERELLKIEQQKVANGEYKGSGALWWRKDGKSDEINDAIGDYNNAKSQASYYQTQLNNPSAYNIDELETVEKLTDANEKLSESALKLSTYYDYLKTNIEDGTWTGDALDKAKEDLAKLETMLPQIEQTVNEVQSSPSNIASSLKDTTEEFNTSISDIRENISGAESDISKLMDGASASELESMIDKYDGFIDVVGKSTAEQIAFVRNYANQEEQAVIDEIDGRIEEYSNAAEKIKTEIARLEGLETLSEDDKKELSNLKIDLEEINNELEQLQTKKDITIKLNLDVDGFNLSDLMNQMDGLVDSTKSLVEAQNQLSEGTALSKKALWELAMQYPELLYQSNLFADGSVSGQKDAINAILDMKKQEFDNSVDLKIAELETERDFIKSVIDLEQQKLDILTQGTVEEANGELSVKGDLQEMLGRYNDIIGEQHTLAEQYKLEKTKESAEGQADAQDQASEKIVTYSAEAGEDLAANITEGAAAGVEGASRNSNLLGNVFENVKGWAGNLASWVAKAFAGDTSGAGAVSGGGVSGNRTNSFSKATYNSHDNTINGQSVSDWIKTQQESLKLNIETYKVQLKGLNNAIANLEDFKKAGLTGVSNNYSSKGAGGKGSDDSNSKSTSKNTDATDKNTEAIEKLTEQYIKNVENLQKRIVNALKKKYQEEYDERKKLLNEEHQARIDAIQKEIDALNGNTPEDKQSELERLRSQYEKWTKDDSTLGKAKQKEYLDQIKELEKEIKLDELQQQLEDENEAYNNSIDKDSEFYDKLLSKLDEQMSDEMLYREANDMIRNGKIQEITDLLTKFDSDWSGWATLMGKSAGEVIAEEVANAISNYVDVVTGNVKADSSSSSSGSSSSKSSSGSSSNKTISKGRKVKISNANAGMYYTSDSKSAVNDWKGYNGNYYVVNTNGSRAALAKTNDVNKAIGWIEKKYLVGLASGGYTGMHEGVAMLHKKERVLNSTQTAAFENLVYNQLPKLEKIYSSINHNANGTSITFNKELMKVDIGEVNNYTDFDVKNFEDDLDRMFRVSLQKSGIRKHI